jgi:hypothetical protein
MYNSELQSRRQHRLKFLRTPNDLSQSIHQPLEQAALGILITVADAHSPGVAPDLGRQEQETQTGYWQCSVLQILHFALLVALE